MELRRYQHEAIWGGGGHPGVVGCLKEGKRRPIVALPVGTGKTVVFARLVSQAVGQGLRCMVLAHRNFLLEQALEKVARVGGMNPLELDVEQGPRRAARSAPVIGASVQTLRGKRLEAFARQHDDIGFLVVDECHRSTAKSYTQIFEHYPDAAILGVTATPTRLDGVPLGNVFDSVAYTYDMAQAIGDGWLVRPTVRFLVSSGMDLQSVKSRGGDYDLRELARMMSSAENLAVGAKAILEETENRKTLVFCAGVAQAEELCRMVNTVSPGTALVAHGKTKPKDREKKERRFKAGRARVLINCELYTEGWDLPDVEAIVLLRATKSRGLLTQMVGRGLRLKGSTLEESIRAGKSDCLILDFTGSTSDADRAHVASILDGATDPRILRQVAERAAKGKAVDVMEEVERAEREISEAERRAAVEAARYRQVEMSPWVVIGYHPRAGRQGGRPATENQLRLLHRHRMPGAMEQLEGGKETYDYGQARVCLELIQKRYEEGKATPRRAMQLAKRGLNPDAPNAVAAEVMDRLAAKGWRARQEEIEAWKNEMPELRTDLPPKRSGASTTPSTPGS